MENKKYHLVKYTENYKNSYNFVDNNDNKLFDENLLMAFTWHCDGSYFIQNKNKEWNYITAGGTVLLSEWASEIRLPWMKPSWRSPPIKWIARYQARPKVSSRRSFSM